MLVVNGSISGRVKTGGGLDGNGNPVRLSPEWEQPIPCHIKVNRGNYLGKQNGNTFTSASYEVLIESQPFEAERVKLVDESGRRSGDEYLLVSEDDSPIITEQEDYAINLESSAGMDLGEFSVMWIEYLEAVGVVKIVV
jgi:hypothetical protein